MGAVVNSLSGCGFLSHLLHDFRRQCVVALGIDLSHVGLGVPKNDLGRFQTKLLPHLSTNRVP